MALRFEAPLLPRAAGLHFVAYIGLPGGR